jgi:hypothetical protein
MKNLIRVFMGAILITGLFSAPCSNAEAATKYITKKEFVKELVEELKLELSTTFSEPYFLAVSNTGIMKAEDFNNDFEGYITRTDAAVLLNRADEYLYRDTIDAGLLDTVMKSRISDIDKIPAEKREGVARCYAKGIITGYSNGDFTNNRAFRGNEYLTEKEAKEYIKLVTNQKKRAKLSPDGQLIRTTNLPKYAKYYPYILDSYKNGYYDWQFRYEGQAFTDPETGVRTPLVKYEEYASPTEIDKITDYDNIYNLKVEDEDVIRYLKCESIDIKQECKDGWLLICVEGYPLGFGKYNKGNFKNKYLPGWRWM